MAEYGIGRNKRIIMACATKKCIPGLGIVGFFIVDGHVKYNLNSSHELEGRTPHEAVRGTTLAISSMMDYDFY